MGGKVIHINDLHEDNTTPKATICGRPQDYEDLPEECKILLLQPQHSYGWKTLQRCHVRCYQKQAPRKAINLNLTLVSRQFHHETALIPFAENHFVISCPFNSIRWSFPTFLDSLNSLQVGNITRLSLHCYVGLPEKGYFDCLLRMKHLKHISLIVKNTIMCRVSNSPEGLGFEFPQKLKADVELDRLRLSQLPVTSARCYMEVTVRFAEPKPDERATTIFNEWQRETEAIILGSTDKFVQLEAAMET